MLGVGGKQIQGLNREMELAAFCELSDVCAEGHEVFPLDVGGSFD